MGLTQVPEGRRIFTGMSVYENLMMGAFLRKDKDGIKRDYVGLYLQNPAKFDDVVEELKKIPEVVECHYTTGGFDMFIKIYARNNHHLLNIIHDKLQPLGLSRSETVISFNAAINRQIPISELPVEDEFDDEQEEIVEE